MTADTVTIAKDMAITIPDFFRLLPRALDGEPHAVTGHIVQLGDTERGVTITIEPAEPRRIALIVVERCMVTLAFTGYGDEERAAFLTKFDRAYQRGGG